MDVYTFPSHRLTPRSRKAPTSRWHARSRYPETLTRAEIKVPRRRVLGENFRRKVLGWNSGESRSLVSLFLHPSLPFPPSLLLSFVPPFVLSPFLSAPRRDRTLAAYDPRDPRAKNRAEMREYPNLSPEVIPARADTREPAGDRGK